MTNSQGCPAFNFSNTGKCHLPFAMKAIGKCLFCLFAVYYVIVHGKHFNAALCSKYILIIIYTIIKINIENNKFPLKVLVKCPPAPRALYKPHHGVFDKTLQKQGTLGPYLAWRTRVYLIFLKQKKYLKNTLLKMKFFYHLFYLAHTPM